MFAEQLGGVFSSVSLSARWRLIISYLTVNSCLSPHIAVSGQCAIFLSGDGREGGGGGVLLTAR